tara:strand:+ start:4611 stop:5327 length:717 start_codon:yes stop_codon:yes gene_type:complete
MKKVNLLILFLTVSSFVFSQSKTEQFFDEADALFGKYVTNGKIDYTAIKKNPETLNDLLAKAKDIKVDKSNAKTYQAFWINAYNLGVIKGVVNQYPMKSPLDDKGFFNKTKYDIGGKSITLDGIQKVMLQAEFNDPRYHFVLVCGALGCPPLISQAYYPNTLEAQLEIQTKIAINGSFIRVNTKKKRVEVSQIMEWYKGDFTQNGMSEIDFINNYRTEKIDKNFKISYFPYDWSLNKN